MQRLTGWDTLGRVESTGTLLVLGSFFAPLSLAALYLRVTGSENWNPTMLGMVALTSGALGFPCLIGGLRERRRNAQTKAALARYPDRPWLADWPGSQTASEDERGRTFGRKLALFLTLGAVGLFLEARYWELLWMVQYPIVLMDLAGLVVVGSVFSRWRRVRRNGPGRLEFEQFPFFLGDSVRVRWMRPQSLTPGTRMRFTLRQVEEKVVSSGSGRHRSTSVVAYERWKWVENLELTREAGVSLNIPLDTESGATCLRQSCPRYWALLVQSGEGAFEQRFLVPVYKR